MTSTTKQICGQTEGGGGREGKRWEERRVRGREDKRSDVYFIFTPRSASGSANMTNKHMRELTAVR